VWGGDACVARVLFPCSCPPPRRSRRGGGWAGLGGDACVARVLFPCSCPPPPGRRKRPLPSSPPPPPLRVSPTHPTALNACTINKPIEPKPITTTLSPGSSGVRLTARTQQARGSTNEPSSALRDAGRGRVVCCTCSAGTRMYSAKPHGSILEALKEAHIE